MTMAPMPSAPSINSTATSGPPKSAEMAENDPATRGAMCRRDATAGRATAEFLDLVHQGEEERGHERCGTPIAAPSPIRRRYSGPLSCGCTAGCSRNGRRPRRSEPRLVARRLEELDGVARRVLDEDLPAADAGDDLVAEARARGAQTLDRRLEVVDLEREPVPAARARAPSRRASPGRRPGRRPAR